MGMSEEKWVNASALRKRKRGTRSDIESASRQRETVTVRLSARRRRRRASASTVALRVSLLLRVAARSDQSPLRSALCALLAYSLCSHALPHCFALLCSAHKVHSLVTTSLRYYSTSRSTLIYTFMCIYMSRGAGRRCTALEGHIQIYTSSHRMENALHSSSAQHSSSSIHPRPTCLN